MSNQNTFNKSSSKMEDIDKEVQHLIKKNVDKQKSTYTIMEELKQKYKDEQIVDAVMAKYNEKLKKVRKIAEKIRDRLITKYPNLSIKDYIEKVSEYKKKYNFDDSEMNSILHLLFQNKNRLANDEIVDISYNEMSKALGFVPASYNLSGQMKVKPDELEQLQSILTIASATKELHSQVTLQSLIYEDTALVSFSTKFDKNKTNIFSFVHPVVAALFLPKIKFIDEHMIIASIANIVSQKYNNNQLTTQPDLELYMDIATDPSVSACTTGKIKPFNDLLNRCNVQTKLWEAVLNLRQGKYYTNDLSSFILAIDNCRNSVFDAADMAYIKDEGTILRKLFGAFSIRPTIVSTAPIYGISSTNNIASLSATHITSVAMLTLRIPIVNNNVSNQQPIKLADALDQRQVYIHHRQLTLKSQQILYSRELLVFYVHRRFQTVDLYKLSRPYQLTVLPITMNAYERLHGANVDFVFNFDHSNQKYTLKSVVAVETAPNDDNLIISCSALIVDSNSKNSWLYSPLDINSNNPDHIMPMKVVELQTNSSSPNESLYNIASKRGTLFIYTTPQTNSTNNNSFFNF